MTAPDPLGRDVYSGRATPAQFRAGRRIADKWDRWAAHTEADRLADFERAEARDEHEKWKHS